jgi:hypothetical protein
MSMRAHRLDQRLRSLIETADQCHAVSGGYRLRFARSHATLQFVIDALDANPALRFQMTTDHTGTRWLEIRMPHEPAERLVGESASRTAVRCVVA